MAWTIIYVEEFNWVGAHWG